MQVPHHLLCHFITLCPHWAPGQFTNLSALAGKYFISVFFSVNQSEFPQTVLIPGCAGNCWAGMERGGEVKAVPRDTAGAWAVTPCCCCPWCCPCTKPRPPHQCGASGSRNRRAFSCLCCTLRTKSNFCFTCAEAVHTGTGFGTGSSFTSIKPLHQTAEKGAFWRSSLFLFQKKQLTLF